MPETDPRHKAWRRGLYPQPSTEGRSRNMRAIRRCDTAPEIELRRLLHRAGLRFRKDYRLDLPTGRVRPDVVFTRARVAIFVDSCFWHSCPEHGRQPSVNEWYWGPKLARTAQRDRMAVEALEAAGWLAVRIWEHEDLSASALAVAGLVRSRAGGA
ncbi:very short patch repair endonuclease [Mycobacterium kyorinense]|uniref:very short patch repair endonuclease n=1 Tax=Mycobacterium kyorinense TaxID=487514 RepID=UPI002285F424|nr:very short patch repair endonuclease [Mycobacterium kyorinense]